MTGYANGRSTPLAADADGNVSCVLTGRELAAESDDGFAPHNFGTIRHVDAASVDDAVRAQAHLDADDVRVIDHDAATVTVMSGPAYDRTVTQLTAVVTAPTAHGRTTIVALAEQRAGKPSVDDGHVDALVAAAHAVAADAGSVALPSPDALRDLAASWEALDADGRGDVAAARGWLSDNGHDVEGACEDDATFTLVVDLGGVPVGLRPGVLATVVHPACGA